MLTLFLYLATLCFVSVLVHRPKDKQIELAAAIGGEEAAPSTPKPSTPTAKPLTITSLSQPIQIEVKDSIYSELVSQLGAQAPPYTAKELKAMKSEKLRTLCSASGLRWRNVKGTKHLTKSEMVNLLLAVG